MFNYQLYLSSNWQPDSVTITVLCEQTNVKESLITALYPKGVIDKELKEMLVRFWVIKNKTFSAKKNI
jgi:hypothetical protein